MSYVFIIGVADWSKNSQQKIKQGQMGLFHFLLFLLSHIPTLGRLSVLNDSVSTGPSDTILFPLRPDRSSKHLPLNSKHDVDHFQATGDFFQDAMVLPQLVELPVAFRAKMQWVASSATQNNISIVRFQIITSFNKEGMKKQRLK